MGQKRSKDIKVWPQNGWEIHKIITRNNSMAFENLMTINPQPQSWGRYLKKRYKNLVKEFVNSVS